MAGSSGVTLRNPCQAVSPSSATAWTGPNRRAASSSLCAKLSVLRARPRFFAKRVQEPGAALQRVQELGDQGCPFIATSLYSAALLPPSRPPILPEVTASPTLRLPTLGEGGGREGAAPLSWLRARGLVNLGAENAEGAL